MAGYRANHVFLKPPLSTNSQLKIRWPVKEALALLESEDYGLVNEWLKNEDRTNPNRQAQMLSARLAEKVTIAYYNRLGYLTKDVSRSQILPVQDDWRNYDILLNGKIAIDVKNARTPVNNKKYYLNHCVPQFKYDRSGKEVKIASVMSPYLSLAQIQGKEPLRADTRDIVVLGEAMFTNIQQIENEFNSDRLRVNICAIHGENTLIPAWVFDYLLSINNANNQSTVSRRTINLNKSQFEFMPKINKHPLLRWSLPVLYLSIWSDFLEKTTTNDKSFDPMNYYSVYKSKGDNSNPLGIRDPLDMIFELIHSLIKLNEYREEIKRNRIEKFQLKGQDSLIGLTRENFRRTLVAYCGGLTIGKAKCGNGPLIIGKNDTCPICGKLICDKCGYCSDHCRRANMQLEDKKDMTELDEGDWMPNDELFIEESE
jgi:hypothetical protein